MVWEEYLHDAIPVIACRHSEQREKGHAKVLEVGVFPKPLTGVCLRAFWKSEPSENVV